MVMDEKVVISWNYIWVKISPQALETKIDLKNSPSR
jgi:hypothetical protein